MGKYSLVTHRLIMYMIIIIDHQDYYLHILVSDNKNISRISINYKEYQYMQKVDQLFHH